MFARSLAILLVVLGTGLAPAVAALMPVPRLTARVTDLTGTLTPEQRQTLEQRLRQFEAAKGSQVAVLIVPTTEPEAIEQYGIRVVEAWKLGRQKVDDGALLLVAKNDRALRIEVGYGLEGALPDAIAKRIIEEIIVPRFRADDFAGGITAGVEQIIKVIEGEPLPPPPARRSSSAPENGFSPDMLGFWFMGAFLLGGLLRTIFGRFLGGLTGGVLGAVMAYVFFQALLISGVVGLFIFIIILLGNMSGRGGGGGYYGGSSRGSGGGFSGGGFSGGGGGFGGGGASGRW